MPFPFCATKGYIFHMYLPYPFLLYSFNSYREERLFVFQSEFQFLMHRMQNINSGLYDPAYLIEPIHHFEYRYFQYLDLYLISLD